MKTIFIMLVTILSLLTIGCSTQKEVILVETEKSILDQLPAELTPIEANPFVLPTLPPTGAPKQAKSYTALEEVNIDVPSAFAQKIMNPEVIDTIIPKNYKEELEFWSGGEDGDVFPCQISTIMKDYLYIDSHLELVGFDGPAINQYAGAYDGDEPLGILVKFKSDTSRVLRFVFRGQNAAQTVAYETGIEFNFFENSDIVFCNYKGREEGAPGSEISIFSEQPSAFTFAPSQYYYMFVTIDQDSNALFFTWQADDIDNYAYFEKNLNQSFGTEKQFKNLDWSLNFNSNYGEGSLNLSLAESYIIKFSGYNY